MKKVPIFETVAERPLNNAQQSLREMLQLLADEQQHVKRLTEDLQEARRQVANTQADIRELAQREFPGCVQLDWKQLRRAARLQ